MKWTERIGRRLKLSDLHLFMTVVEMRSMGKAAERLAVSQPSVSKAIADLEHTIGVRLLDRTVTGVVPTAYGLALLMRSIGAFDELRQGIKDLEALADPTVGEVRIGCPEAIASGFLVKVLEPIREVLESDESDVIPCWALDSLESARCGSPNIALSRTAVAYVTRAI